MTENRVAGLRPLLFWALLALVAALMAAFEFTRALNAPADSPELLALYRVIAFDTVLPRNAMALICGAGLGLSGLLLQQVLRNPLAEPSTLGIAAGAQLAMTAGMLYLPAALIFREWLALAGGLAAVSLVLALNWKRVLEPASVILCGMIVSLTATAASTALILANGEYVFSLFVWGGGSLEQQSWGPGHLAWPQGSDRRRYCFVPAASVDIAGARQRQCAQPRPVAGGKPPSGDYHRCLAGGEHHRRGWHTRLCWSGRPDAGATVRCAASQDEADHRACHWSDFALVDRRMRQPVAERHR
ncbi:hypothetical protein Q644_18395 [Brucella intermedia 229E]|uniref:Uncharacterized protein n=1 Tax=Brucella intermedia 229E TaxID=1337887 RepID=U4VBQ6_9HYPH|nr:hypothetical protein Q644_18395 [Brucella intermedia 229E]